MTIGATQMDTSPGPGPYPVSSVIPTGTSTPKALEGGPVVADTDQKAPASVWTKDGNDVTSGLTTDAAVTGDTAGTKSAKLRGINKILFDLWDSTNHWLQVKVMNVNANGQTNMAGSAPVAIASNQTPVPISGDTATGSAAPATAQYMGMKAYGGNLTGLISGGNVGGYNTAIDANALLAVVSGVMGSSVNGAGFTRTPDIFHTVSATASGNTAIWTPPGGHFFRILRYFIQVTSNAAIAGGGVLIIQFEDASVVMPIAHAIYVPSAAGTTMTGGFSTGWVNLGNGIISSTVNNALNLNLSATLTAGAVRALVAGIEE